MINTIRLAGVSIEESVRCNTRIEAILLEEFPDDPARLEPDRHGRNRHGSDGD